MHNIYYIMRILQRVEQIWIVVTDKNGNNKLLKMYIHASRYSVVFLLYKRTLLTAEIENIE